MTVAVPRRVGVSVSIDASDDGVHDFGVAGERRVGELVAVGILEVRGQVDGRAVQPEQRTVADPHGDGRRAVLVRRVQRRDRRRCHDDPGPRVAVRALRPDVERPGDQRGAEFRRRHPPRAARGLQRQRGDRRRVGRRRRRAVEVAEPGRRRRHAVRRREVRLRDQDAAVGTEVAGGDGRAVGLVEHPPRTVGAEALDRLRTVERPVRAAGGAGVHRGGRDHTPCALVAEGLAVGGLLQPAAQGVQP